MPITNFPHGFAEGVTLRGVPVLNMHAGNVWWVDSGIGSDNNSGKTKEKPFATLDYAVGRCTANNGDYILVAPGHAETVATVGAITCDVAGVTILGLGNGSDLPKFTLTGTAATIAISADNVTIKNVRIVPGIADIVTVFHVTGAWCTLDGIVSRTNSTYSIKQFILTAATTDELTVCNCDILQTVSPGATSHFIELIGADNFRMLNNTFYVTLSNHATSAILSGSSTASLGIVVRGNNLIQVGGTTQVSVILLYSGTTGLVTHNSIAATMTTLAGMNSPASCWCNENYVTKAVTKSGILDPVVS